MHEVWRRMYESWELGDRVWHETVRVRFRVAASGDVADVEVLGAPDPALGRAAREVVETSGPFPAMSPSVACLADTPLVSTFGVR